ncbi:MAG: TorF family putative porin [Rikenellaceae bacterium]
MKKYVLGLAMALCASTAAMAEVSVSGGADVVSSYNWRGIQQSGPAIQPGMAISAGNFSLGAWGSSSFADITSTTSKELDFTLAYEVGKFSIAVTDYWWSGETASYMDGAHQQEVTVGFAITDALSVAWSTVLAGSLDEGADGQMYSSYLNIAYAFEIGSVACDASLGINPYESAYGDSFGVSSIALRFTKELVCSDTFSIPFFVETSIAPLQSNAYLVAGMSFGF